MSHRRHGVDHWFEPLADHMGPAYLRYAFTYGTEQEVSFLVEALGLEPGMRVLDVGCGPGRHARALAERGIRVHGIDISATFVELAGRDAPPGASFERADARAMGYERCFDAVISLCQGAFGLAGVPGVVHGEDPDGAIVDRMAAALVPGGLLALTAFSAYFQVAHLEAGDCFDAGAGVNHERTEVRSPAGEVVAADLWTSCFTPRELRLFARGAGLEVEGVWSVAPGAYARRSPDLCHPELLLVARRPGGDAPIEGG